MKATLKIEHDEKDDFVTVTVDCKHGVSTAMVAQSSALRIPNNLLVLGALADHADNQTCDCTADLWRRYGQVWKAAGLPFPPFADDAGASSERQR